MIAQIISGGQCGVDIAALRAATAARVCTSGWMPRGWRTQNGPRPQYAVLYGMREHRSAEYRDRTIENVKLADVTVRIARDFDSPGERCTLRALITQQKPYADIAVRGSAGYFVVDESDIFAAAEVIDAAYKRLLRDVVVNVAGNSARTVPEIEDFAQGIVKMLIDACAVPL